MTATPDASRSNPRVFVQFSHPDRRFAPSETLAVRYEIEGLGDEPPSAVEHSVLWYTEGKGEEDLDPKGY